MNVYYEIDDDEEFGKLPLGLKDVELHSVSETVRHIEADESNAIKIGLMIYRDLSVG